MGQPDDFTNFISAVIDKKSYANIKQYIDDAENNLKETDPAKKQVSEIIRGDGQKLDESVGYFIPPTIIVCSNKEYKSMKEEIFGTVLSVYIYPDEEYEQTLKICDETSPYALTGSIFAQDRYAIDVATKALVNSSGNFYINDKCTGAVVGQQPFGGARASGTNDKAGSNLNLLRWVSARSIKENFIPLKDWSYPHHK